MLDAAALRPPLHLLPSLAQRRGTPHPPPLARPHRVAGRLVRAARCCPRQQPVPHSALSTGFTFKFTARIFGGSCARLSRLSRRRRASAEPRSGTASSSACPTSLPPSPTPAPTPCSAWRATRLPAGCGGACCSARCTETCTSWRRCMPPTLRDVSVCAVLQCVAQGQLKAGSDAKFPALLTSRRRWGRK